VAIRRRKRILDLRAQLHPVMPVHGEISRMQAAIPVGSALNRSDRAGLYDRHGSGTYVVSDFPGLTVIHSLVPFYDWCKVTALVTRVSTATRHFTVRLRFNDWLSDPEVPLTVSVYWPAEVPGLLGGVGAVEDEADPPPHPANATVRNVSTRVVAA
jgi:hypothetical protein